MCVCYCIYAPLQTKGVKLSPLVASSRERGLEPARVHVFFFSFFDEKQDCPVSKRIASRALRDIVYNR